MQRIMETLKWVNEDFYSSACRLEPVDGWLNLVHFTGKNERKNRIEIKKQKLKRFQNYFTVEQQNLRVVVLYLSSLKNQNWKVF